MIELFKSAQQAFLLGQLSEAFSLMERIKREHLRLDASGEPEMKDQKMAFRRFKAIVAKCRQRDQMLSAIYAPVIAEAQHG